MPAPFDENAFLSSLGQQSKEVVASEEVVASDDNDQFSFPSEQEIREREKTLRALVLKVGLFSTSECVVPGWRVVRTLPMITARRVLGINAWQDFTIAIRDLVGGRSQTAEAAFERLESELLLELQARAASIGCQAVVGVHVQFGEISGGGKAQLFYAAAQGTPVQLEQVPPPQNTKPTR